MPQNNIVRDCKTHCRETFEKGQGKKKLENTRDPLYYSLRLFTANNKNALQGFVNNATFPETRLDIQSGLQGD